MSVARFLHLLQLGTSDNEHEGRLATSLALKMVREGKIVALEAGDPRLVPVESRVPPPPAQRARKETTPHVTMVPLPGWFPMVTSRIGTCEGCHQRIHSRSGVWWKPDVRGGGRGLMRHLRCRPTPERDEHNRRKS